MSNQNKSTSRNEIRDRNGIIPKEGDTVIGLYPKGDDTGIIIRDVDGELAVKDSDGDIILLESALAVGTIKQVH